MILRRVIQHFRNQEWTDIFIDFLIVVFGVFIGIQVANWNQAQNDKLLGKEYLKRIQVDVEIDIANYHKRMAFWQQVINYGNKVLSYAENKATQESSQWALLLAFFQASQISEFYPSQATYNELTNAGELRLLGNVALRKVVTNYYKVANNPGLSERPKYREHVRGLLPIQIQSYIWQHCHGSNGGEDQALYDCEPPPDLEDTSQILQNLVTNQTLLADLRYWISTQTVGIKIANDRVEEAKDLNNLIASELKAAR
jgi:hypothetical protein